MLKDYSSFGPAYRNFKVREGVYVPEPEVEFPGDNPFARMTPIRGKSKDILFVFSTDRVGKDIRVCLEI